MLPCLAKLNWGQDLLQGSPLQAPLRISAAEAVDVPLQPTENPEGSEEVGGWMSSLER